MNKDIAEFLDWIVAMDLQHYETQSNTGHDEKSHWYIKHSPERFTSEELVKIYRNRANKALNKRWLFALTDQNEKK